MGKYYEAKPFKIHAKRKKHSYREILGVINKKNENFKIKKNKTKKTHKQWQVNKSSKNSN